MSFIKEFSWDGFENADGSINTHHTVFQQGRHLYEAQVIVAKLDKGEEVPKEDIRDLAVEFCRLVNAVGQLKYYYGERQEKINEMKDAVNRMARDINKI